VAGANHKFRICDILSPCRRVLTRTRHPAGVLGVRNHSAVAENTVWLVCRRVAWCSDPSMPKSSPGGRSVSAQIAESGFAIV
jgi:hypothetical protein